MKSIKNDWLVYWLNDWLAFELVKENTYLTPTSMFSTNQKTFKLKKKVIKKTVSFQKKKRKRRQKTRRTPSRLLNPPPPSLHSKVHKSLQEHTTIKEEVTIYGWDWEEFAFRLWLEIMMTSCWIDCSCCGVVQNLFYLINPRQSIKINIFKKLY